MKDLTDAQSRLWTSTLGAKESESHVEKTSHTIISNGMSRPSVELLV